MAEIVLENITKKYGDTVALDNISLTINDNEFFVLFGPAGAGKTTTLKTIAGIEFPQEGLVKIGGEIVNHVEPMNRNVSMVFESYALYPNLTVYDNIASPMRSKLYKRPEDEIKQEVDRVTKMMHIDHLLDRQPSELSNGQRQRVAVGRCLVRTPNVFLMDEPLAHLDAKLRHFMRGELKEMQNAFNTTTIYVTHDYMEAMSLADRIAVLNKGSIEQIGTAIDMYYLPCNEFVAKLFGEPEINIFRAQMDLSDDKLALSCLDQDVKLYPSEDTKAALKKYDMPTIDVGIRGNDVEISFTKEGEGWILGSVYAYEPIGNKVIMTLDVNGAHIQVTAPNHTKAELNQEIFMKPNMDNALYFSSETEEFLTRGNLAKYQG